jgi:hypothetical protein
MDAHSCAGNETPKTTIVYQGRLTDAFNQMVALLFN